MAGNRVATTKDVPPQNIVQDQVTLFQSIKEGFSNPQTFVSDVFSGAVIGFINAVQIVPMSALIFAGALTAFIPEILGVYLICGIIGALMTASISGYKTVVSEPRMIHLPIYVAISLGVISFMKDAEPAAIAITIISVIVLSSLAIGLTLYIFGRLRLGAIVRFVPLPVTAGILASMGILVCVGAIEFASGPNVSILDLQSFFSLENIQFFVPGLLFGFALYYCTGKFPHWSVPLLFLFAGTAGFYLVCMLLEIDLETAKQIGWLPSIDGATGSALNISIFSHESFKLIDLSAILSQSYIILSFVILTVILVMLEISAIEVNLGGELDANHELVVNGKANLAISALGGAPSIIATTDTMLLFQLGGKTFVAILSYCIFFTVMMTIGMEYLSIVPNFVFSGFIIISGIPLVKRWFFGQYNNLPKSEFIIITCIVLSVVFFGIIEGFVVGALLAVCLFVYNYSKLDSVKISLDRSQIVSIYDRSMEEQHILDQIPERLQIFRLQGFLFFGSSHKALTTIRSRLNQYEAGKVKYIILDFHHVNSLDTSAVNSFLKLFKLARSNEFKIILSACDEAVLRRLKDACDDVNMPEHLLQVFQNIDEAVGWCDDDYLSRIDIANDADFQSGKHWLEPIVGHYDNFQKVSKYFEPIDLSENETLFEQGDKGDALYFIAEGQIDVVINVDNKPLKIRSMKKGAILGEMTLLNSTNRTASAIAVTDCKLYRLSTDNFAKMKRNLPQETLSLVSYITNIVSERLARANNSISALSK